MGIDLFNRLGFQVTHNGVPVQSVELASRFPEAFRDFGKVIGYNHRPNVDTMHGKTSFTEAAASSPYVTRRSFGGASTP